MEEHPLAVNGVDEGDEPIAEVPPLLEGLEAPAVFLQALYEDWKCPEDKTCDLNASHVLGKIRFDGIRCWSESTEEGANPAISNTSCRQHGEGHDQAGPTITVFPCRTTPLFKIGSSTTHMSRHLHRAYYGCVINSIPS